MMIGVATAVTMFTAISTGVVPVVIRDIKYGAGDQWQGPATGDVDARDYTTLQAALNTLDGVGGTLLLDPDTVYRESVSLRNEVYPDSNPVIITTRANAEGKRAKITGADILTGLTQCTSADEPIVGSGYANLYKVTILAADAAQSDPLAYNLHEDGVYMPVAIDRAITPSDERFTQDANTWHSADSKGFDASNRINSYTHSHMANQGYSEPQLIKGARALVYGGDNRAETTPITGFNGSDTISFTSSLGNNPGPIEKNYAILNILPNMKRGQWGYVEEANGDVVIYLWPNNPSNATGGIEYSVRTVCIDTANASNYIIEGVKAVQAAGATLFQATCIGTHSNSTSTIRRENATVRECITGKTYIADGGGYGSIFIADVNNVTIENNSCFQHVGSSAIFLRESDGFKIENNDIGDTEISAVVMFGFGGDETTWIRRGVVKQNRARNVALGAHANGVVVYRQCDEIAFIANDIEMESYFAFQAASNLWLVGNRLKNTSGVPGFSGNRCLADQNSSNQNLPDPNGKLVYLNNHFEINSGNPDESGIAQISNSSNQNMPSIVINNIAGHIAWLSLDPAHTGIQTNNVVALATNRPDHNDQVLGDHTRLYQNAATDNFAFVDGSVAGIDAYDASGLLDELRAKPWMTGVEITDLDGNSLTYAGDTFVGARNPGFDYTVPVVVAPPGTGEILTHFSGDDQLDRSGILQKAGADIQNSNYGLIFFSIELNALPVVNSRLFGSGNDLYIDIRTNGELRIRAEDTGGGRPLNHNFPGSLIGPGRINGFIEMNNDTGSRIHIEAFDSFGDPIVIDQVEPTTSLPFKLDYTAFQYGDIGLDFNHARFAWWQLASAPPDISDAVVRDAFRDSASGETADVALSEVMIGEPPFLDIHGDADALNSGGDQSVDGNNFVMNGLVTDIM